MPTTLTRLPPALQKLKDRDDRRPGFPGEHWLVLAAGVAVLLAARRSPSPIVRALGSAAGSALLVRAASGRDGLARVLTYLPVGKLLSR
ncbi:MAG: hypothetical protein C0428_18675 [Polaromonas sp.]|nr:hypothetical protein [Polaromonas sp.]